MWASSAIINDAAEVHGTVVPMEDAQTVPAPGGGTVSLLAVHTGDMVAENQLLVRLRPPAAAAAPRGDMLALSSLRAEVARLEAELENRNSVTFPADLGDADAKAVQAGCSRASGLPMRSK